MKYKTKDLLQKINWTNTLFLLLTPVVGIGGLIFLILNNQIHLATVVLTFVFIMATGLTITAGYHRLFSHNTYQANAFVRVLFLIFGAAAFQGSALEWCTDHRNHHRYSETEKDPYNIDKGFWFAHIGWLILLDISKRNYNNVEDLSADKWLRWQHRYFNFWSIAGGFLLPTLIASLWGDALGGFLLAGVFRTAVNHHATFCINSVCHLFGKRGYSLEQTARDHWFTALFTHGEGFHNFHHQFPLDYRNGIRFYDYDPTKWLIWTLSKMGLTHDLKVISVTHLTRYRLRRDEQDLLSKFKQSSDVLMQYIHEHLSPFRTQILEVIARIESIEKSGKIKEYKRQLKAAHSELNYSLSVWARLIKSLPKKILTQFSHQA